MLVWLSLAVSLAAALGALAFAGVRALRLWRQVRATLGALGGGVARVAASAEAVAVRAEGLGGGTERLDEALSRLAASRARLRVLQEAWSDVGAAFGRVSVYVPREKKA